MEKYELMETLGNGSYGIVYKALEKETREYVAIKQMKKKYSSWEECKNLREVKSLTILKHNNIIRVKEMIRVDDNLNLIFEFMEMNVYELMQNRSEKQFNENEIRSIIKQTLEATAFMHKYGVFHRDLKPENLLVKEDTIKIADFGLAREIRSLPPYTDYVATRWYRAPECILRSTLYNSPIDIWAIGTIMAELYNYKPLFPGATDKDMLFKISTVIGSPSTASWPDGMQLVKKIDFKFPNFPNNSIKQLIPNASDEAIDVINQMLRWDPSKRPTAQNLLEHSFFDKKTENISLILVKKDDIINKFNKSSSKYYTHNNNHERQGKTPDLNKRIYQYLII